MSKHWNIQTLYIFSIIIILAVFFVRLINLDQDIAPWGVSLYQPADEGAYAYLAINEKIYGTINPTIVYNGQSIPIELSNNFITNILGNAIIILGFKIFGNNYYGLRVPYVAIGLFNLIIFWQILRSLRITYGKGKKAESILELGFVLWMLLDFSFFNASRIVEPTSIRLLFVQLVSLIFIKWSETKKISFLFIGMATCFSCLLVYITNVFLLFAVIVTILMCFREREKKVFCIEVMWFTLGTVFMLVVAECYYYFVWGTEAFKNAFRTVIAFSSNSTAELTINSVFSLPYTLALLYARIISSNILFYNLPLLFALSVFFIPIVRMIWKRRDRNLLFLFMIVLCFLLQTFLSSDTITRKIIVIYPTIMSLIYVFFASGEVDELQHFNTEGNEKKRDKRGTAICIIVLVVGGVNTLISFFYRTMIYDWTEGDFDQPTILILAAFQLIPVLFAGILGVYGIVRNNKITPLIIQKQREVFYFLGALACISNLVLIAKYYWIRPEYSERDSMIELAEYVDNKYVLGGGFQLGFTLYNEMKPVVNIPEETLKTAKTIEDSIYFDYEYVGEDRIEYFKKYFFMVEDTDVDFLPIHIIERRYQTFGTARNMCLYRLVEKSW
ncbi:MAG: hypothetical protein IJP92_03165 [Lachnospiraceae bacterium]|nr:hypothetical protein [Lachnospiraceae bacterium]